ncbi:MAG: DUF401 family protein [Nitrospirae bacterium]|nr:DUF401 family protein [Nitrospirota bacterium]
MSDIIKIAAVFFSILLLLRLKWNIGYVLLSASALLALLYSMSFESILETLKITAADSVTIKLFFSLTLIRMLEMILREKQIMAKMTEASRSLLKKKRAVIISMPLLIGMLPSLGGAYFSAPMVDEATKGMKMSPEEKGFINYWFRHPWEFVLPLYPGILLAAALTNIELRSLMLANTPYAVLVFITGFALSMRSLGGSFAKQKNTENKPAINSTKEGLLSFLPVMLVLLCVIVFHIELQYTLAVIVPLLFAYYRSSLKDIWETFKYGFAKDVLLLIAGMMIFKFTMDRSGAVEQLSQYFTAQGIPVLPILIGLPFISGLLTGLTIGYVGSTFPLLISIAGGVHLNEITLAFAAGFVGVLLSPVHLCLVLTREYFKADMAGIYRRIIPGCAVIMAAALAEYFLL